MQGGGDRAEAFKKIQALNDKRNPEIRAVLTPEQQTIFDKNLAEQKARMEQMRQGGGPGNR
jgi:Spy/CpxP family protein refolding chaperone